MIIAAIILLIILGIVLLILEFFVIPGATVVGIGGFLSISGGIYMSYINYGTTAGNLTAIGAVLAFIVSIVLAFKSGTWRKMSLSDEITSKVNTEVDFLKPGDKGITVSRLAPMGKIMINDVYYEAKSESGFIDHNIAIIVSKIINKQAIVAPVDTNENKEV